MRTVWRTAKAWGYVTHDPFEGVMLPEIAEAQPRCFAVEEALRIIANAKEPYRTLYWLAAETGMRAGELCGLRWQDVDFDHRAVRVRQSSWNGHMQTPKSAAGRRTFAISAELAEHLRTTKAIATVWCFSTSSAGRCVAAKLSRSISGHCSRNSAFPNAGCMRSGT